MGGGHPEWWPLEGSSDASPRINRSWEVYNNPGTRPEGPAHLKCNLFPAIEELESIGFLEPLGHQERFQKQGGTWRIRLVQKSALASPNPTSQPSAATPTSALTDELIARAVTAKTAAELVQRHQAGAIAAKLEVFDWLISRQDKRVAKNPAGYLVKSIADDFAAPQGFVTKAEAQRQEAVRQEAARQATEKVRRQQAEDASECQRAARVRSYRQSQTSEQLARLEADAIAQASEETRRNRDDPIMKPFRKTRVSGLVNEQIARLLPAEPEPA